MREDTDPGIGGTEPPKGVATLRPGAPRLETPSLLATQVGLGAVRLDAHGSPVFAADPPALSTCRFVVRPGPRSGDLILCALGDQEIPPPGLPVVALSPASLDDARIIDALR